MDRHRDKREEKDANRQTQTRAQMVPEEDGQTTRNGPQMYERERDRK